jgi:hypothetical protein
MQDSMKLNDNEYHVVWDKFYNLFDFTPSPYKKDWPSIKTSLPQIKFDIKNCFKGNYDEQNFNEIDNIAKLLFDEVSSDNDRMYALDWQHESFDFNAKKYTEIIKKNNEWFIPTFPNRDYYIFLTKDFKNVWF